MTQFSLADVRHITAAEGWIELGNHIEANAELDNITPTLRSHPDVLEIRFEIYSKESKWDACLDIANAIVKHVQSSVPVTFNP